MKISVPSEKEGERDYKKAEFELIKFEANDVITTSGDYRDPWEDEDFLPCFPGVPVGSM